MRFKEWLHLEFQNIAGKQDANPVQSVQQTQDTVNNITTDQGLLRNVMKSGSDRTKMGQVLTATKKHMGSGGKLPFTAPQIAGLAGNELGVKNPFVKPGTDILKAKKVI